MNEAGSAGDANVTQNTEGHVTEADQRAGSRKRRHFMPGRWFWFLLAGMVVAIVATRFLLGDPAPSRLLMAGTIVLMPILYILWFAIFSAHRMTIRLMGAILMAAVVAYFPAQYRYVRMSGGGKLQFARRNAPDPTTLLETGSLESNRADLSVEGPSDFPFFLGPNRNQVINGIRLDPDWKANPPQLVWKRPIGAAWSAFAARNGYAVTMEQRGELEMTTCYEIESGEPVWRSAVERRHEDGFSYVGPRSTPTIYEGRVYSVGATGFVRCLDGATGEVIWERDPLTEMGLEYEDVLKSVAWGRSASALIERGKLFLPVGGEDGKIVTLRAMDPETGETLWDRGQYQIAYATPVLATLHGQEQILSVNQDVVTAHDIENGDILWEHEWPGLSNMNANCTNPIVVEGDRVLLTKGYTHGAELLQINRDGDDWSVESIWAKRYLKTKFSNVSVRDGFAYGLDDGILNCVEIKTGRRAWKKGRYNYGQILLVRDLILVLSEDGELALVEANPKKFVELARVPVLEGQTWNTLCLYGDLLLVRNAEEAACYRLTLIADET